MYTGKVVTVQLTNALPYESVSFDWQSSSANLMPDVSSTVFSALQSNLGKLVVAQSRFSQAFPFPAPAVKDACAAVYVSSGPAAKATNIQDFSQCLQQLTTDAALAVKEVESLVNPDSASSGFATTGDQILCRILGPSPTDLGGKPIPCPAPIPNSSPFHDLVDEQARLNSATGPDWSVQQINDAKNITANTGNLITPLGTVAMNLLAIRSNPQPSNDALGTIVDPGRIKDVSSSSNSCNASHSKSPGNTVYGELLQRQVSCAVNVVNLVADSNAVIPTSQLKKTVVVITVNYADSRIETSAGILVSALPSRSFAASSTYTGTPPTVSSITVQETDTRPLIVPYAAVQVRLGSDWLWKFDKRRGAIYATGLVGVNPNTTTADFGAGISVAWRSLVLSPVAHFAHDVGLTGGFTDNEQLGTSFTGTLPTKQFWTTSFGIGIGIRVPLIPGR
jgi:hypothetical protein